MIYSPVKKGTETDFRLTIARICHVGLSVAQSFVDYAEAESVVRGHDMVRRSIH